MRKKFQHRYGEIHLRARKGSTAIDVAYLSLDWPARPASGREMKMETARSMQTKQSGTFFSPALARRPHGNCAMTQRALQVHPLGPLSSDWPLAGRPNVRQASLRWPTLYSSGYSAALAQVAGEQPLGVERQHWRTSSHWFSQTARLVMDGCLCVRLFARLDGQRGVGGGAWIGCRSMGSPGARGRAAARALGVAAPTADGRTTASTVVNHQRGQLVIGPSRPIVSGQPITCYCTPFEPGDPCATVTVLALARRPLVTRCPRRPRQPPGGRRPA